MDRSSSSAAGRKRKDFIYDSCAEEIETRGKQEQENGDELSNSANLALSLGSLSINSITSSSNRPQLGPKLLPLLGSIQNREATVWQEQELLSPPSDLQPQTPMDIDLLATKESFHQIPKLLPLLGFVEREKFISQEQELTESTEIQVQPQTQPQPHPQTRTETEIKTETQTEMNMNSATVVELLHKKPSTSKARPLVFQRSKKQIAAIKAWYPKKLPEFLPITGQDTTSRRNPNPAHYYDESSVVFPPPFPWATIFAATVHKYNYLMERQMWRIIGEVICMKCKYRCEIIVDLRKKFFEIATFIARNKSKLRERAPNVWTNPYLPSCLRCKQKNCARPIIPRDNKRINWLFLFLGQWLGCCSFQQLIYFCYHTNNNRIGPKDGLIYLAYLTICKQLDPRSI